ncbi:MAG: manganese efflux pump [Lachnospiraceae bacterium]|nr:manganese efflux pump [Lachnospiraceae bacterium]
MGLYLEIFLIGVGLAMDAFAVSVCKGLAMQKVRKKDVLVIGIFFGGFQAFMPFIGWLLGTRFEQYIVEFDHWLAFILLSLIGGKMIYEVIKGDDEEPGDEKRDMPLDIKELFILAIATSIDALAVGITFAFLSYPLVQSVAIIGITTFFISAAGVFIGNIFGNKFEKKAGFAGGVILILIGLKILLEHLDIISI